MSLTPRRPDPYRDPFAKRRSRRTSTGRLGQWGENCRMDESRDREIPAKAGPRDRRSKVPAQLRGPCRAESRRSWTYAGAGDASRSRIMGGGQGQELRGGPARRGARGAGSRGSRPRSHEAGWRGRGLGKDRGTHGAPSTPLVVGRVPRDRPDPLGPWRPVSIERSGAKKQAAVGRWEPTDPQYQKRLFATPTSSMAGNAGRRWSRIMRRWGKYRGCGCTGASIADGRAGLGTYWPQLPRASPGRKASWGRSR
jgi:hypothetical protein